MAPVVPTVSLLTWHASSQRSAYPGRNPNVASHLRRRDRVPCRRRRRDCIWCLKPISNLQPRWSTDKLLRLALVFWYLS